MPELHVSKKSISKLFSEMQNKKFIIPDFQRPYKWNIEKCETLWNDIENFANTDAKLDRDYFLGTIVSYINEDKNQEIIDGQQRITSFFLLLRSFYKKLENMQQDNEVVGLKNKLAPCIWDTNRMSGLVEDTNNIHILSLVATSDDNDIFHNILKTGDCNENAMDNYSVNYRYFKKQCDEYATSNPMQWKELCVTILDQCIVLPIECDTPETALTIFSTLNDRGLPLADSDIFKAQIYRNLQTEEIRKDFTTKWKELTHICKQAKITIDDVFRYYTHILRARNRDKSREIGLRKFYAENNYSKLKNQDIIPELMSIANFWRYVNVNVIPDEEVIYKISLRARKYLHCLNCYPNEYWKYAVTVFFLKNINSETFDEKFCNMLQKLVAFLFSKFIEKPSVNAIKDDIFYACIKMQHENQIEFNAKYNNEVINNQMELYSSSRISRALLLLDAYLNTNQNQLIPETFDIEHIFPKKWQDTNYNGWTFEDAELYLDKFGNKIVLEKKLNIQAGNGYFGLKKLKYANSKIATINDLSNYENDDWLKEDIIKRELEFKDRLLKFFNENL